MPPTNAPTSIGRWELLPYSCPIQPLHAVLLHTNKVFFISGSGNDPNNVNETKGSAVWDYTKNTFFRPLTPVDAYKEPFDLFCGGHSFLADGHLLFAGGTLRYDPFEGIPESFNFSPVDQQWTTVQPMAHGRWYPTLVTLGNGRILAVSGLDENGDLNRLPEIYAPSTGWIAFSQLTSKLPLYSHLFLLSNGKLFYSGAQFRASNKVPPRLLTLPTDFNKPIIEQQVSGLQDPDSGDQAGSVLLPPAQDQRVMIIGGGNGRQQMLDGSSNPVFGMATKRVNIVDLKSGNPTYRPAASLNFARMHVNAVLLPDRTVFVCGGSRMSESGKQATTQAEIYNPATNTWTVVANASVPRLYHSVALLLPDGRVVSTGGNPRRTVEERRIEIYSPPYLFKGPRPVIESAPQTLTYGGTMQIQTPQAQNIKWVNLIKPCSTTHSCNTEQRLVDLVITSATSTVLNVKVTNTANLAPRGWYMLFITDFKGVPSVAQWVRLLP